MPSRQTVSHLLYEEKAFAAEMAIRISIHVGGTPESLLRMQKAVALWEAGIKFKSNPYLHYCSDKRAWLPEQSTGANAFSFSIYYLDTQETEQSGFGKE